MKKVDIVPDHELLKIILQFQLTILEHVAINGFGSRKEKTEILDYITQYRKELFEDEIHVD